MTETYKRFGYLEKIEGVANDDVAGLREAQKSYSDSWKKRGGASAFFMLSRKWDRIEEQLRKTGPLVHPWDIFMHAAADQRPEGIMDDIRDLRRYLMLVEAELRSRGINPRHRDNELPTSLVDLTEPEAP